MEETTPRPKFRVPAWLRNKYVITAIVFVAWVAFFDDHNILYHYRLSAMVNKREEEKTFYTNGIQQTLKEREEVFGTPKSLEKFAREKYGMKKDDEDLFKINEKQE